MGLEKITKADSKASRRYEDACGAAHALDLVGERWALLVVRELVLGPKRFTDLRRGLPRIPTNILSDRLKELEDSGVVRRRVLPRPAGVVRGGCAARHRTAGGAGRADRLSIERAQWWHAPG